VIIASFGPDTEADWQPFARELAGAGIAALTFQMPSYRDLGGTRDPAQIDKDFESAVLFIESRDYPLIYLLSDLNASVGAIKVAARKKIAGLITVSGFPEAGGGVSAMAELPKVTAPKLFIAGQDSRTPGYVQTFLQVSPEPKQSMVFSGPGVLTGPDGVAAKQLIRDFLLK
jgi:hypothetical protein